MKTLRLFLLMLGLGLCFQSFASGLRAPEGAVVLTVAGNILKTNEDHVAAFDLNMLDQLPQHSVNTTTPWFDKPKTFTGPLARDVLKLLGASGTNARAVALNDYHIDIPTQDFDDFDVILATRIDGEILSIRDKGPLFIIYPFDQIPETRNEVFFQRCIWQLVQVIVE
ncbi:hypothetical protein BTA51_06485 [Hahella sp. CCB-MM4]|uniref:hypothetical protein n=1 Tax=Hahella sp. (strain CCB-MM4) TaxID=1926491 RepID=UPI000B9A203E|nr:hypothetical protein [Hahella sp. CCB-MM4]OZG74633.1 hypothetical protein BTA51_06485 [Hahella sp. CCB-MM4]